MLIKVKPSWYITSCRLVHSYRRFGEAWFFNIKGWSSSWGLKVNTASHLSRLSFPYLSWNSLLPSSKMCLCLNILRRHNMCCVFTVRDLIENICLVFSVVYMKSTSVEFLLQSMKIKTNDVKNIANNEFIIVCNPFECKFRRLFCLK